MDIYFGSIEGTIAFKEYLLKSEKDFEDVDYLRKIYKNQINEKEINKIKHMIDKYILNKQSGMLSDHVRPIRLIYPRDKTHAEHIGLWANFVVNNTFEVWKKQHTEFIDSMFIHSQQVFNRILKEPNGAIRIREIKDWNKKSKYWFEK